MTASRTILIAFVLSALCNSAIAQPRRDFLSKPEMEMLQKIDFRLPADSTLLKKGVRFYNVADLQDQRLKIDLAHAPRLTIPELKWKLKDTGDASMPSPEFFQQNIGQSKAPYNFLVQTAAFSAGLTPDSIAAVVVPASSKLETLQPTPSMRGNLITLTFKDALPSKLVGRKELKGKVSSFIGRDVKKWNKDVPAYDHLVNERLYDGVTLIERVDGGRLLYSFILDPSAALDTIRVIVAGCDKLYLDKSGNLVMQTNGGPIVQTAPRFFDVVGTVRTELKGRFVVHSPREYGFQVDGHNQSASLYIDPEIVFSTYFGGSGREGMLGADNGASDDIGRGFDIQVGNDGDIFVVGRTASADLPVTNAGSINGNMDIFVLRIDSNFQIAYAVFLGGSSEDRGRAIAIAEDGIAYVTGFSFSSDLPLCPSPGTPCGTLQENGPGAYILKVDGNGALLLGTFLGAQPGQNHPNSIKFEKLADDPEGHIYVAGYTTSDNDATTGSFQAAAAGDLDAFAAKLNEALSQIVYYTYLGGAGRDIAMDIDVKEGFAYVCGMTASTDFPTTEEAHRTELSDAAESNCTGSLDPRQCADAFLTRLNLSGSELRYSTYFGNVGKEDFARGVTVNADKEAYITGASKAVEGDSSDILVAKFSLHGDLFWETYMPGEGRDHGEEIVVDQFDRAHVTGTLSVAGHQHGNPTPSPFNGGASDMFYARFLDDGENDFTTYLGGSGEDRGFAVAAAGDSVEEFCATIVGSTVSDDVNVVNPLPDGSSRRGEADVLLVRLCDIPFQIDSVGNFAKSAPANVNTGDRITFNITVNNDSDVSGPVRVTDTVPGCVSDISTSTSFGAGCVTNGNQVVCEFDARPGPNTISITGTMTDACCGSQLRNSASLSVFGREIPSSSTTNVGGCPAPPPPPPHCGNGVCEPNLGETCHNCADCPIQFLDEEDLCSNIGECESCPPGTTCKQEFVGVIACDWQCYWPIVSMFHDCSTCGNAIYTMPRCFD